jgi:hypothetical protein
MTKVYVSEYASLPKDNAGNIVPIAPEPPLAEQVIDYSGGAATITLGNQTRYVRLNNDSICSLRYDGSAATTSNARSPADTLEYKGVQPGSKISAITNT